MPQITLRPLRFDNVRPVVRLQLGPEQRGFVASNADSIAEAYVERSMQPRAIYADDELVGFAMYGQDPETGHWWLIRFMIDERFQRRGYGRAAMLELIALLRDEHQCESIRLGVDPANHAAIRLYSSLGFRETGEIHYDETVMCLDVISPLSSSVQEASGSNA